MGALSRAVYAVFGTLAIVVGAATLVMPQLVLGDERDGLAAHLVREEAAAFVFIGLMYFWCLRHFAQRRPVHLGLLLFSTLFAAIHWVEYIGGNRELLSPLLNSVPALALLATAPFRREGRDSRRA